MRSFIIISCIGLMLLSACSARRNNTQAGNNTSPVQDTVQVLVVQPSKVQKSVEFPAQLLPYLNAKLYARVQGYVKNMNVDIGDRVHKGQMLAVITAPEVNAKINEFESSIQSAYSKYQTSLDNWQRIAKAAQTPNTVAPVDLEQARNQMMADSSAYLSAKSLAQSYRQLGDYLVIKAPFDGVITTRKADPGDLVDANTLLLNEQEINTLRLRVQVPEEYIGTKLASDKIAFRVDAYPGQLMYAKLARKSGALDPVTLTELWEFDYDNKNHLLRGGDFAYAELDVHRADSGYVVPFSTVVTNQENKFVVKVKDNKISRANIRQGFSTKDGVEIFGDIHDGDTLVLKGTDELTPGTTAFWQVVTQQ